MVIPRSLLFKGLGLCTLCGGVGVAIHQKDNIASLLSPSTSSKITRGNLECEEPTQQGGNCVLKTGEKIFVKKGNDTPFELTSLGDGKIKVYKDNTYEENSKFLIEDNDISGSDTKKLEEFESYEIKKGTGTDGDPLKDNYYLSRKTESKEEIKKALGLTWDLPTDNSSQEQTITTDNLGTIKFKGGTAAVSGTVKLIIKKDSSKEDYPLGYKFTFKNSGTSEATLTIGGTSISLKNGSDVDFKINKNGSTLSLEKAWTVETLAEKVGLKKENDDYWTVGEKGLNVKLDGTKKTNKTKHGQPTGKLKVYTDQEGYNEGLKFSIEMGDIDLKENGSETFNLGQFQSFEIVKEDDGNWYLSRKEGDQTRIKELLGLQCELPTNNDSVECTNISTIKFTGAGDGTVTSSGSPKLTIHKESGRLDYPLGYKFVFSSEAEDSSIIPPSSTSITLKKGISVDYKIKISEENKESLSLEKAFTADYLMGEASFNKSGDAWVLGGGGASIKQGTNKSSNVTVSGSNSAKIRVYEGVPGYNQGMKFVVEDGDTSLDNSGGIGKLSKYETYEVVKESDGYWYLSRKKTTTEAIKDILGLPENCSMPSSSTLETTCSLDSEDKLKAIKFEGKGDAESVKIADSGNSVTLKISKTSDKHFPKDYKFTLESEKDVTIPQNGAGQQITIKKNTNTEFKIKEQGNKLTLERAWSGSSLGEKIKLKDCNQEKKCSFGDNINVFENENNYVDEATIASSSSSQKITYEENADGYNQGIKFYVEEDITLENGTGPSNGKVSTICKKNGSGGSTYQIMEKSVGGNKKWYLVKK